MRTVTQPVVAIRRTWSKRFRLDGLQSLTLHQFRYSAWPTRLASRLKFLGNPTCAIATFVRPENITDQWHQTIVCALAFADDVLYVHIVSRTTDLQRFTNSRRWVSLFHQQLNYWVDIAYPFWLKILNAFFKMSRSLSTVRSCSSNSRTRVSRTDAA